MNSQEKRRALLVLGMHRSGTSALAGLLGEMGCDLPRDVMAPAAMNAKGFFESNKISYFNEELLASVGMTWFDLNRFPNHWFLSPKARSFESRALEILRQEYPGSRLFVLEDPRICRLIPFWRDALIAEGCAPAIVCIHRNPLEVSWSLERCAGYEPQYGQLLWLRHVLDAEADTRGMTRVFVSYDQVLTDWRATVSRISRKLDIVWPRPTDIAAKGVGQLLSADMRHVTASPAHRGQIGLNSDWLRGVYGILERWSESGEDSADYAALDGLRKSLDEASSTLVPVTAKLLERYREILHLREVIRENEISLRKRETSPAEANAPRPNNAIQLQHELNACTIELARARQRPFRNLNKYMHFKILEALSSTRAPLPAKMKLRLQRSAEKRAPKRSLLSLSTPANVRPMIGRGAISYKGAATVNEARPSILIVSHDASRTGAPIVALNLVQALAQRYNVTTLCLRGGEIIDGFCAHSVAVWVAGQPSGNKSYFSALIDEMKGERQFAFAIVNSIESRHVLSALRRRGIASVALLHEFASNTLPKTAFSEVFRAADQLVFSTELTLDDALSTTGQARTPKIHVIAQGKCDVPLPNLSDSQRAAEREQLMKLLRPVRAEADRFLVIGAGYVHIRKGVDLFIDVARRVLAQSDGKRAFFAWIGAGYSPDKDGAYSVYLKDQVERAGLTDRVIMIPETSEIEHVYSISNSLIVSSRLDPLPNVAIDAMSHGVPVLCFDKTSGIADLLLEAGLKNECVAEYLDTTAIADRILNLMRSPEAYDRIQTQTRAYAADTFQFACYAARIEQLALSARSTAELLDSDIATIAEAGRLRPDFMLPHDRKAPTVDDAAKLYVVNNWSGHPRRPEPGFHPTMYWNALAEAGEFCGDSYAEFLRRGRPQGPWLTPVICNTDSRKTPADLGSIKVALHIHAYYPNEFSKIIERLPANNYQPDLYVSVADSRGIEIVQAQLSDYRRTVCAVRVVPNNGRDIGPLLTEFGPELIRNYDVIGHVHTKRSEALADRDLVDRWTYFLYENVIGGERGGPMLDRIIGAFAADEKLGIVYPEDPSVLAWSSNEPAARELAPRLGIGSLPKAFDFPVGTMFWIRSQALAPFVKLNLRWDDYPTEPVPYDGTMLHALERLFGVVPENLGFGAKVTNIVGLTR